MSNGGLIARLFLSVSCFVFAETVSGQTPQVKNYVLDVTFYPDSSAMRGTALVDFAGLADDTVTFFLHGELRVTAVSTRGEEEMSLSFRQRPVYYSYNYSLIANRVDVSLDGANPARLLVEYGGFFNTSRARSPSDYMRIDRDGVYLRAYGYSLWFPVFLEAGRDEYEVSFSRVTIRTPADLTPVFVGQRVEDWVVGDEQVSIWSAQEVSLFAAQITARRFEAHGGEGFFIYSLPDPASSEKAELIENFTRQVTELARANYRADAAAAQVHVMQMPRHGDISSDNVVGISDEVWSQFDAATSLTEGGSWQSAWATRTLAHELIHPFVWVPTPRGDPLYALSVEGFPSYFHLPLLAEIAGEAWYEGFIAERQARYLDAKEAGRDSRGRPLPAEKPLLEIAPEEISVYKDRFLLNDRALLFFDYLRRRMGEAGFTDFTRNLFNREPLNADSFRAVILEHLTDAADDLTLWLETTEYPKRFRL